LLEKRQADAAGGKGDIEWRGRSLPLRPERVKLYVLSDQQLDSALSRAKLLTEKLELLEDNLMDCKEAISSLRNLLQTEPVCLKIKNIFGSLRKSQLGILTSYSDSDSPIEISNGPFY